MNRKLREIQINGSLWSIYWLDYPEYERMHYHADRYPIGWAKGTTLHILFQIMRQVEGVDREGRSSDDGI